VDLNSFYLKYLLWIPSEHIINPLRLIIHGLSGSVAIRESFQYFTDKSDLFSLVIASVLDHKPGYQWLLSAPKHSFASSLARMRFLITLRVTLSIYGLGSRHSLFFSLFGSIFCVQNTSESKEEMKRLYCQRSRKVINKSIKLLKCYIPFDFL
jgi:hypothetical protein